MLVCVFASLGVYHMCTDARRGQKAALDPLKEELQAIQPMWEWKQVLSKAAHALISYAWLSPQPIWE